MKRSLELLKSVGLERKLAHRYPAQLSGGQQQRVGVARALAADPLVLLMDEPFSAVDPVVRSELHEFFLGLQRELGKTIILITHDIDEAIKLGDQVAIMRVGGHLAQVGTPQQLLDEPADAFVEGFVGRDRGFRSLSFQPASVLSLDRVKVVRDMETASGPGPILVVDGDARPVGWADPQRPGGVFPLGPTFSPGDGFASGRPRLRTDLTTRTRCRRDGRYPPLCRCGQCGRRFSPRSRTYAYRSPNRSRFAKPKRRRLMKCWRNRRTGTSRCGEPEQAYESTEVYDQIVEPEQVSESDRVYDQLAEPEGHESDQVYDQLAQPEQAYESDQMYDRQAEPEQAYESTDGDDPLPPHDQQGERSRRLSRCTSRPNQSRPTNRTRCTTSGRTRAGLRIGPGVRPAGRTRAAPTNRTRCTTSRPNQSRPTNRTRCTTSRPNQSSRPNRTRCTTGRPRHSGPPNGTRSMTSSSNRSQRVMQTPMGTPAAASKATLLPDPKSMLRAATGSTASPT